MKYGINFTATIETFVWAVKQVWYYHINSIVNKASRTLNFLKRNLSSCSQIVKESAYFTIVRPILEYASVVWDPYQQVYINSLEKIQRRSVRWVCNNYSTYSSVTTMIESLNWVTLRERRKFARLSFFHDIVHKASVVNIPPHFLRTTRHTRHHHPLHFIHPSANTTAYQNSYFPRTIIDWNSLSTSLIEITDKKLFLDNICS